MCLVVINGARCNAPHVQALIYSWASSKMFKAVTDEDDVKHRETQGHDLYMLKVLADGTTVLTP